MSLVFKPKHNRFTFICKSLGFTKRKQHLKQTNIHKFLTFFLAQGTSKPIFPLKTRHTFLKSPYMDLHTYYLYMVYIVPNYR